MKKRRRQRCHLMLCAKRKISFIAFYQVFQELQTTQKSLYEDNSRVLGRHQR